MQALVSGMMATPAAAAAAGQLPTLPACDVLLCGTSASCRSSLALHFALHHAARTMLPALYLCRQDSVEQTVPLLPHHCSADDPTLHLLHIKYLNSYLDLQRFACCLHLLQGAYSAIVVEDIGGLVRTDDRNTLIRTLALLLDGVRAYRVSSGCGGRCPLLATDSGDEARRPRYIYDRWFPLTLVLSPNPGPSGANGSYCLCVAGAPGAARSSGGGGDTGYDSSPLAAVATVPSAVHATSGPCCIYRSAGSHLVLDAVHGIPGAEAPLQPGTCQGDMVVDAAGRLGPLFW